MVDPPAAEVGVGVSEPVPAVDCVAPEGNGVSVLVGVTDAVGELDSDTEGELEGVTPGREVLEGVGVLDREREVDGVAEGAVSSTMICSVSPALKPNTRTYQERPVAAPGKYQGSLTAGGRERGKWGGS